MCLGGMHGEGGVCMVKGGMHEGGVHGKGRCVAKGGMDGKKGAVHGKRGVCGKGGHAWQKKGCAWYAHLPSTRYGRSMRGWYASYWNAFLFASNFNTNA